MPAIHLFVFRFVLLTLALASFGTLAASSARTDQVQVELLLEESASADTIWAAVHFQIIPHWHVYWRNPGDSGEAPKFHWRLPDGWEAGEIQWPVPRRVPFGP
ncbi:MAG: protein-disulfide reductase DsbD domain-containing protein, partial [Gammaproteobacteria bacterium]